ncbi:MAG: ATP-dependent DNA ligase, partial [uncultured Corynebacteriales bacterium]
DRHPGLAPGRAAVRRLRGDQAGAGRLPGADRGPAGAGAGGPAAVGGPGPRRPGAVHAEEPAGVRAGLDRPGRGVGGAVPAGGDVRAVQRHPDAAVVRQPAGRGVPPDADPGARPGLADHDGAGPGPAGGRRLRRRRRGGVPGAAGAGGGRDGRGGEDQRVQGAARDHPGRRRDAAGRGGRGDPGAGGPGRAAGPGAGDDRVPEGRAAREGVPGLHPGRRGDGRRRVQPAGAAGGAGVLPGGLGGIGRDRSPGVHCRDGGRGGAVAARLAGPAAGAATPRPRAGRGGPDDPDRPGAGDARGEAPGAGPARGGV